MQATGANSEERRRRVRIVRAGILAVVAILVLANVFAASITINSGSALTFGQGQASVTACDASVDYSIGSEFVDGAFAVKEIVATINDAACEGKQLIVIPYEVSGTSTIALDYATITLTSVTAASVFTVTNGATADSDKIDSGIPASSVFGVALEIKD